MTKTKLEWGKNKAILGNQLEFNFEFNQLEFELINNAFTLPYSDYSSNNCEIIDFNKSFEEEKQKYYKMRRLELIKHLYE